MPTMNDVAKLAGVSRGTVSNYINGVKVKVESQLKIKEAIEQLNYIPNVTARELKMNRSNLVVFIIPTTQTPFFAELTHEIQQTLKHNNFKMLLCNSNNDVQEELEYIQMAKEQKVAGIITISYSELNSYLTKDLPIVSIEKKLANWVPCISSDNYFGGQLAAKKLVENGAKKLLLISRTTEKTVENYGQRAQGFFEYCKVNNIDCDCFDYNFHEDRFYPQLDAFLERLYQQRCPYDGIFAVADQYADFCLNTIERFGHNVPKDCQIIGFDGGKMYPEQQRSISSIRQPISLIAKESVEALKKMVNNRNFEDVDKLLLKVSYISGKTTKN